MMKNIKRINFLKFYYFNNDLKMIFIKKKIREELLQFEERKNEHEHQLEEEFKKIWKN
jgi:hypothetical protein